MADTKITALAAIATVDPAADVLPIVDISDTSMAASGTTKKVTSNQILGAGGTATLASATITGVATFAVTTGGTERCRVDSSGNLVLGQSSSALQSGGTGVTVFGTSSSEIKFLNSTTGSTATDGTALVATTSNFSINNREAGTVNIATSNTNRLVIEASGDVTVSTGNVVMATSGKGIDFSATANSSGTMTSELLNDYEEGTWTPTVGGTWIVSPTSLSGTYTKVGRIVTIQAVFSGSPTKASSTSGYLSGLPFNIINNAVGSVSDDGVSDKGNCLAANSTRIWLTDITFGSGTTYVSVTYTV